jgi:hypothetical protein
MGRQDGQPSRCSRYVKELTRAGSPEGLIEVEHEELLVIVAIEGARPFCICSDYRINYSEKQAKMKLFSPVKQHL